MNFNAVWEKHRKFLLIVTGGLAGFMVLHLYAAGYRDGAAEKVQSNKSRAGTIESSIESLDGEYDREVQARKVLEQELASYLDLVGLAQNTSFEVPGSATDCQIDFQQKWGNVWSTFVDAADKIHLSYPRQRDVSFSLSKELNLEQWTDKYRLLEVVSQVLDASVELGVKKIESLKPAAVKSESLDGVEDRALLRYSVAAKIVGDYASLRRFVEHFHRDHNYLTVEMNLETDDDLEGALLGEFVFSGVDIGSPREEDRRGRRRPKRGW